MRPFACGHFIKHRACGIDVGAPVGALPAELLRSHVGQSANDLVRLADGNSQVVLVACRYPLRQAKIQDLQAIVFCNMQVARLQVAMDDPLRMGCFEAVGQLCAQPKDFFLGQRPARELVVEGDAGDQFHYQEVDSVFAAKLVDRLNIGMVQFAKSQCLAAKALACSFVGERAPI